MEKDENNDAKDKDEDRQSLDIHIEQNREIPIAAVSSTSTSQTHHQMNRLPPNVSLSTTLLVQNALARHRMNQRINQALLLAQVNSLSDPFQSLRSNASSFAAFDLHTSLDLQRCLQATQKNLGIESAAQYHQASQVAANRSNITCSLLASKNTIFSDDLEIMGIPQDSTAISDSPTSFGIDSYNPLTKDESCNEKVHKEAAKSSDVDYMLCAQTLKEIPKRQDVESNASMYLPPLSPREGARCRIIFPQILHQLLRDLEKQYGGTSIASFLDHGRAFIIHKPKEFENFVMPRYFDMTSFSSFRRQLNLYNFQQVKVGPDHGAYYHEYFLRQQPELCAKIKRAKKVKGGKTQSEEKAKQSSLKKED